MQLLLRQIQIELADDRELIERPKTTTLRSRDQRVLPEPLGP